MPCLDQGNEFLRRGGLFRKAVGQERDAGVSSLELEQHARMLQKILGLGRWRVGSQMIQIQYAVRRRIAADIVVPLRDAAPPSSVVKGDVIDADGVAVAGRENIGHVRLHLHAPVHRLDDLVDHAEQRDHLMLRAVGHIQLELAEAHADILGEDLRVVGTQSLAWQEEAERLLVPVLGPLIPEAAKELGMRLRDLGRRRYREGGKPKSRRKALAHHVPNELLHVGKLRGINLPIPLHPSAIGCPTNVPAVVDGQLSGGKPQCLDAAHIVIDELLGDRGLGRDPPKDGLVLLIHPRAVFQIPPERLRAPLGKALGHLGAVIQPRPIGACSLGVVERLPRRAGNGQRSRAVVGKAAARGVEKAEEGIPRDQNRRARRAGRLNGKRIQIEGRIGRVNVLSPDIVEGDEQRRHDGIGQYRFVFEKADHAVSSFRGNGSAVLLEALP